MDSRDEGSPEQPPRGTALEDGPNYEAALAAVVSLAQALDLRDVGTANHSRTVGRYAQRIARELGLPAARAERIRLAGLLHDIGKIGIPDSILQKPEPLTQVEWDDMKRHPRIGARIVAQNHLQDIGDWILAHHERPDGTGYPHGLREPDIPLEAKILAVADAYEAMTARRPYRPSLGPRRARDELRRGAGRQFDRRVD
jgi:putative nucleotidyltransferase with HDIG domain